LNPKVTLSLVLSLVLFSLNSHSEDITTVTILSGLSEEDQRHLYEKELIVLALEKTRAEYGDYQLQPAPPMTHARGIESMRRNILPNFIRTFGFDPTLSERDGFAYVKFPIHRGITGFRTCFIPEGAKQKVANINSVEELKTFSYGMGLGWTDSEILRYNGFYNIEEVANYTSLFKMTSLGRIDFFCRGTNEILNEYNAYKDMPGLAHDKSFAIHYPIPLLLYAHKENKPTLDRIEKGLLIAVADGTLNALWSKYYMKSIDFADLSQRKIYYLESPFIETIGFDFEKFYFIRPPK